jgi:hypothetical protein
MSLSDGYFLIIKKSFSETMMIEDTCFDGIGLQKTSLPEQIV